MRWSTKYSRALQILGALAICAAGLWVFLRDADLGQLRRELLSAHPLSLLLVAALTVLTLWLRALRWQLMLPPTPEAHNRGLFGCVMIGFMLNNILPARIGEAARALLLWRRNRYPATVAVGSLIVERVIDVAAFLAFFWVPVLVLGVGRDLRPYAWPMCAGFGALVAGFVAFALLPRQCRWVAGRVGGLAGGRFRKPIDEVLATLDWTRSGRRALAVALLSPLVTGCYAAMLWVLADRTRGFGLAHGMVASSFAALGAAIPLAPGYVGTLHASLLKGLLVLGQEAASARAQTILYHAIGYVTTTLLGVVYFVRLDMRFRDVTTAKEAIS